jgi:hypothetical protein
MPLSSVVGAQSIVKPGVCTSSTRPASPYDGQVIYETDTDRAMVWNGTGWVVLSTGRANSLGLDLIKTQTIGSAVSSVTVSDAFSSTYDNYKIIISGGVASATISLNMTLGSTSTGYYYAGKARNYAAADLNIAQSNGSSWYAAEGATSVLNGSIEVLCPNLAKNTFFNSTISAPRTDGYWLAVGGYLSDTTAYTAFTLTASSGTMTGGTIRVYGYVNS